MADGTAPPLTDAAARLRIADDLATTLFVDAGAGSGKTRSLVERVLGLVTAPVDPVPLRHLAVITFTEKAAAELRHRLRAALGAAAADEARTPHQRQLAAAAVDDLDAAAISTLHAFAQRLLTEHPTEAGLPPRVEVLDVVASGLAFAERWERFEEALLADEANHRAILLADACGVRIADLRSLAQAFGDNWDLVAERVDRTPDAPPGLQLAALVDRAQVVLAALDDCTDRAGDKLAAKLEGLAALVDALGTTDEVSQVGVLAQIGALKVGNVGRAENWGGVAPRAVRDEVAALAEAARGERDRVAEGCVVFLAGAVARFTLEAAAERRAAGQLEFHDLLVLARALLRDPEHGQAVRAVARDRYRRLLLDEFQDTDPIQLELAVLLAAPATAAVEGRAWHELAVEAGRLFVVGDPKQSIYRFRRADVRLYLAARRHLGAPTDRSATLTLGSNFRTTPPVLSWINHTFERLFAAGDDVDDDAQPAYASLAATRAAAPPGAGPPVCVLGATPHADRPPADELRAREAADVATAARRAVDESWQVTADGGGWRAARWGDIAVLVPARTSLPALEAAFDAAGVPFRAETSSLVYATPEVRALLWALRAVADPTDELALVSALRSSLFGCGDDDLVHYRHVHGGRFRVGAPVPDSVEPDHPVAEALALLADLHRERAWRTPSELLARLVAERRVVELGMVSGRPRDLWRRVRFVVDQARAWEDAGGSGLRGWLAWAARQGSEAGRASETVLPETDDDAVRILTVHAAKGLEFPITIVSGMSARPNPQRPRVQVVFPAQGVGYRVGAQVRTRAYVDHQPIDEQLDHHERVRLLYVACTRARDHLVVSLHRAERAASSAAVRTNAELLAEASAGADHATLAAASHPGEPPAPASAPTTAAATAFPPGTIQAPPTPDDDRPEQWWARRRAVIDAAGRRRTVAATTLGADPPGGPAGGAPGAAVVDDPDDPGDVDPGLVKGPRDLELPPWLKGRYGTAIGRAVHATLQTVDLATGDGLTGAARAQAAAEGLAGHEARVEALARAALASPTVAAAAAAPHWREVYLAAPVGDVLLEGYVDLLARLGRGLVIVDYKTAAERPGPDRSAADLVARYHAQGAAYALLAETTLGEPVAAVVFVLLYPEGAVEVELPGLAAAVAAARARLTDTTAAG